MRLFPEGSAEVPCDCVVDDHWGAAAVSTLFPKEMIAGSIECRFIHPSFASKTIRQ